MKIFKSLLAFIVVLAVITSVAGLIFIRTHGKAVLEKVLSRSFDKKVKIGTLTYIPPLMLVVDHLKIDEDFTAKKTIVELKPGSVSSYIRYKLTGTRIDLKIKSIWIEEGSLNYPLALATKTLQLEAKDITLLAENLTVPLKDEKTSFDIKGILVNGALPIPGDRVEAVGWVNYVKKDLQASAKLKDSKGNINLAITGQSQNNDMTVQGNILLNSVPVFAGAKTEEQGSLENIIADTVEAMKIVVNADFSFKTKMDNFKVEQLSFRGNVSSLDNDAKP